jgi:hypothetical protein
MQNQRIACSAGSPESPDLAMIIIGPVLQVMFRLVSVYFSLFSLT